MSGAGPGRLLTFLRWSTGALGLAAFVWVLRPLLADLATALGRISAPRLLAACAGASIAYALLYIPLTEAWRRLLALHGPLPPWRPAWWCFGIAQWAKYLPGNVLHLVGRQVLGRNLGCSQAALAAASLLEMLSLLAAATWLTLLLARFGVIWQPPVPWPVLALSLAIGLLCWPILLEQLREVPGAGRALRALPPVSVRDNLRALLTAQPLHLCFLGGSTIVFAILHWALRFRELHGTGLQPAEIRTVLWVVPAAWLAGVLTPGAPGGLGVREAVLALGLGQVMPATDASALALCYRVVTVCGDGLVALSAWAVRYDHPSSAPVATNDPVTSSPAGARTESLPENERELRR